MSNHIDSTPKPIQTEEEGETRLRSEALKIANAAAFPMVLKAAFELGVIDALWAAGEDAWLSPSEIASGLRTRPTNPHAPSLLDRMLRVLTSYSLVKCRTDLTGENGRTGRTGRVYAAEPVCRFFLNGGDGDSGSFVSLAMVLHSDVMLKSWQHLKDIIQEEGRDAFSSAHGVRLFEYIGADERFGRLFNRAMSESTVTILKKVLEVYRGFEDLSVLVDVGGGHGTLLGMVTSKYPKINGINFDLAGVLAHAPSYPGVEHVVGDMFVDVPKGDAILMK
ncbi:PREDICTED: indole glucosinolate O-methyltransferase 1-like, partial [Tarenaya hassleriana]